MDRLSFEEQLALAILLSQQETLLNVVEQFCHDNTFERVPTSGQGNNCAINAAIGHPDANGELIASNVGEIRRQCAIIAEAYPDQISAKQKVWIKTLGEQMDSEVLFCLSQLPECQHMKFIVHHFSLNDHRRVLYTKCECGEGLTERHLIVYGGHFQRLEKTSGPHEGDDADFAAMIEAAYN